MKKRSLLALVAGVVPVIPTAWDDHVIKVGVGKDDPGVLPHGAPHVELPRARHPTVHESKAGLLAGGVPVLCCNGPKPLCNGMEVAILQCFGPSSAPQKKKKKKLQYLKARLINRRIVGGF